jgi:hypothetical protein
LFIAIFVIPMAPSIIEALITPFIEASASVVQNTFNAGTENGGGISSSSFSGTHNTFHQTSPLDGKDQRLKDTEVWITSDLDSKYFDYDTDDSGADTGAIYTIYPASTIKVGKTLTVSVRMGKWGTKDLLYNGNWAFVGGFWAVIRKAGGWGSMPTLSTTDTTRTNVLQIYPVGRTDTTYYAGQTRSVTLDLSNLDYVADEQGTTTDADNYDIAVFIYLDGTPTEYTYNPSARARMVALCDMDLEDNKLATSLSEFETANPVGSPSYTFQSFEPFSLGRAYHSVSFPFTSAEIADYNIQFAYGNATVGTFQALPAAGTQFYFPSAGITLTSGGYTHAALKFTWTSARSQIDVYEYANGHDWRSSIPSNAETIRIRAGLNFPSYCSVRVPVNNVYPLTGSITNFWDDGFKTLKGATPMLDVDEAYDSMLETGFPLLSGGGRSQGGSFFTGTADGKSLKLNITFTPGASTYVVCRNAWPFVDAWFWRRYKDITEVKSFSGFFNSPQKIQWETYSGQDYLRIPLRIDWLSALVPGPISNQRHLAYKIQYLGTNPDNTAPVALTDGFGVSPPGTTSLPTTATSNFAYFYQKDYTSKGLFAYVYVKGLTKSQPLHKFNLTMIYDVDGSGSNGHSYYRLQGPSTHGNPIPTAARRSYIFYYDASMTTPTGSFGSVIFESDDIVVDSRRALDKDGRFFIKAGISGISNANGFVIDVKKGSQPFVTVFKSRGAEPILTITPEEMFDKSGNGIIDAGELLADEYSFKITPCAGTVQSYNLAAFSFYDDKFGSTGWSNAMANGIVLLGFSITFVDFKEAALEFTDDGRSEPHAGSTIYTSLTGIYEARPKGYVPFDNPYLVGGHEAILDQLEGGALVNQVNGFTDSYQGRAAFKLFDPGFSYVRTYAPGDVMQFGDLLANRVDGVPAAIDNLRGIRDGTYTLRARYNYIGYGTSSSIRDSTFVIQSKRSLTIDNDAVSSTSYSGDFVLGWNPIGTTESHPSDLVDMGSVFYIVIYGSSDSVNIGDFSGNLATLPSGIKILESTHTDIPGKDGVWEKHMFGRDDTSVSISGSKGWGSDGSPDFTGTVGTWYFAVLPVYKVKTTITGQPDTWYHGDISNVVTLTINKQVFLSLDAGQSEVVGDTLKIYSQGQVSFEAIGITSSTQYANGATLTVKVYTSDKRNVVESTYSTPMTSTGSGRFEIQKDIFSDIGVDDEIEYASIRVDFDFTDAGIGPDIPYTFAKVVLDTSIRVRTSVIVPVPGEAIRPTTVTSGTVVFSVVATTDPDLAERMGMPYFEASVDTFSISSVTIRGHGDLASYGSIQHVAGTYNWQITLDNVLDLAAGVVYIDIVSNINNGYLSIDIPATIEIIVDHAPSTVVTSPVLTGGAATINGYDPITVKWLAFFGTTIIPDNLQLDVRINGAPTFFGAVAPTFYYYQYVIDPLDHEDGDVFKFTMVATSGDKATEAYSFTITILFKVSITIDVGDFEYYSSDPPVNGKVDAFVDVEYPASYYLYYVETGTVITDRQKYTLERDVGDEVIIFRPLNAGSSTQLVFDMSESIPKVGDVDRIVFEINGPAFASDGFSFPSEFNGTVYVETFSLTSNYRFAIVEIPIRVSFKGFESNPRERWQVTVNGVNATFSTSVVIIPGTGQRDVTLTTVVPSINPGQTVIVSIKHYYEAEVPGPEPGPQSLLDQIIAFFLSIIATILGLLGLAIVRSKRAPGQCIGGACNI